MRRSIRNIPISVLTILCIVAAVSGSAFVISSGTWQATGTLSSARVGASAALLPDGRILVIGGNSASGPVASADFLNTDGTVSPAPPMVYARASHVSVALQDGRVLVAGGVTAGGSATSTAEIFDPVANSWTSAGVGMTEARSGATAALLQDGRVLIAGGQNGTASSSTIETFDPNTSTFKAAGMMSSPRTEHAMTVLQDGRVLIVGGSNGTAPVASTDIFDPVAGTIGAGPVLSVARFGHSVTTLLNGVVVVIGGNNGNANSQQADVTPTEIFDPSAASPAFTTLTAALATPREGHLAILLPNNNSILIVDGTSGGAAVSSPELFSPQESAQGVWTYSFASADLPNPNAYVPAVRSGSAGSANQVNTTSSTMVRNGIVALAGGNDANGNALNTTEAYGYPVVQTDQSDYPPGTAVTITGSGFRPSEAVTIQLVESPLIDTHGPYTVQADANGNISDSSFVTDSLDVNVRFYLTAAGASSGIQAQNSFTDGNATSFSGTVKSSATSTPISGAMVTCTSGCTNTPAATTMTTSDGAYVFDGKSGDGPKLTFNGQSATITVTASAPGFNSNSISSSISQGGTFPGENIPLTPSAIATTTTVTSSAGPSTYGQSVTFTATIASGMTAPTGSVQFKVDGVNSGTAVGVSPCSPSPDACATLTTSTLSAGSHTIEADFVGTGEFTNSFNTFTQMVNTAPLTATVTAGAKQYDGTTTAALHCSFASGVFSGDTVTCTATGAFASKDVATPQTVNITNITLGGAQAGDYKLTATTGTTSANITPASLTATVTADAKQYDSTTTATLHCSFASGVFSGDTVTCTATGAFASKDVATPQTVNITNITLGGGQAGDYKLTATTGTTSANITPALLTATVTADAKQYDSTTTAALHCSFASGVFSGDTVTCTATGAFASKDVATPQTVNITNITLGGGQAGDYSLTTTTGTTSANITPAPLTATVTADTKQYDGTTTAALHCSFASGVFSGDMVNCTATGAFASKDVATPQTVNITNITLGGGQAGDYSLTARTGTTSANITPAPLTATVTADAKQYDGTTTAALHCSFASGVFSGDMVNCTATGAFASKDVATPQTVNITNITLGGAQAGDYSLTATTGTTSANITPAPLTATVTADAKQYDGTTTAALHCSFASGVFSSDMVNCTATGAFASKDVATPQTVNITNITLGGGQASDYKLTTTTGTTSASITPAPLTITANGGSFIYGGTVPTITAGYSGFVNGESAANLTTQPNCSTTATSSSAVIGSPYQSTCAGAVDGNYSISYVNGTVTENPAPLTITADNKGMILDGSLPAFTATYNGLVLGQNASALTGTLACTTTTNGTMVGTFTITCLGETSTNYAITYKMGTLTVQYASGGVCDGDAGHLILQPINADGTSVFKGNSTSPAKFRVCDANGISIGTAGVVKSFNLVQIVSGTLTTTVDDSVDSTTPDTAFRWDPTGQQWIFNINNKSLSSNQTYFFRIDLNDGTSILFDYGLR